MINFKELFAKQIYELGVAAANQVAETTYKAYGNWKSRYGNNARVGGPELAKSTIKRKGHDRKLDDGGRTGLKESIQISGVINYPSSPRGLLRNGRASHGMVVYTDHPHFPVHEYGLDVETDDDGNAVGFPNRIPRRPTKALTDDEISEQFDDEMVETMQSTGLNFTRRGFKAER